MAQINHWKMLTDCDLSGYTLIIPSVAVGNVGQLACDLVISSLNMRKIGFVYSPALIPILGYDPYKIDSNDLSGSCELYQCADRKVIILLLRAPLVTKYGKKFLTEVVDKLFKGENIKDIIILTSSFAHERKHIMTSPFRYAVNEFCTHTSKLRTLDWVEHESTDKTVKILGGGFASVLFEIIKEKSVPCLVLYKFVSEGDNIPDAYEMVEYLNTVVRLFDNPDFNSQLIHPVSWNLMFGGPPPIDIY